jgi:hypothetical protein
MSLNRAVALATPLFAAAAGFVATWLADNIPGVSIDPGALEEIFIAGALVALAPAAQWLHGWQKYEAREADSRHAIELAHAAPPTLIAVDSDVDADFYDDSGGLADADRFDGSGEFDELGELDELEALDELEELDDIDEALLAEEEEPAPAGG